MKPFLTRIAAASSALLGALLVSGCGGGATADTTPQISISSVKVFGDSLQDSGTFGFKATVQTANNLLYVERIAAGYNQTLCNYFVPTSATTFTANNTLSAAVPANLLTTSGHANVTVFSPTPGGGLATAAQFSVRAPLPAVT